MPELAKYFTVQVIKNEEIVYGVKLDLDRLCMLRAESGQSKPLH